VGGTMAIVTIADVARHQAEVRSDRIAMTFENRQTSYAELDRRASQVANGLIAARVKPETRIAILDKNHDSFFEIWFGAAKAGAVLVPINWRLAAPEIEFVVRDAGAEMLFVGFEYLDMVRSMRDRLATVREIIVTDRDYFVWRDGQSAIDPWLPNDSDAVCAQIYTSGTTGHPKGVQLTHRNILSLLSNCDWIEWHDTDINLIVMPLFHVAGSIWGLFGLYAGAHNVMLREVVPQQILDTIGAYRITKVFFVPAVILFLLQCPGISMADPSSLQQVVYGASPIPVELLRSALGVFKCDFVQVYGLTEATAAITYLPAEEHADLASERLLSCGRPCAGVEIRVVDVTRMPVAPRQVGEIVCRSAQVMKGYWNRPEETAAAVRGDWLYTGDAGYFDEAGFLYIYDRVKDMIVSGGENIYPAEVESALFGHPAIADVAVIGVPDDRWGEAVKAIVVLKPDQAACADEIIAYARERIAGYKLPKSVDFANALPRNPSGKILKRLLREPYWQGQVRQVR
jgi:acyl-CoA synthetase (AMP-forming)/AMP-acid ligase II